VADQLAGKSSGQMLEEFGGFGGGGGRGRGGPGGPGGPGGFGPGNFIAGAFMSALDADKDQAVSKAEFTQGFAAWFTNWNAGASGPLTEEKLRAGIDRDLTPFRGDPPGAPGFGPPPGAPAN
jgi:hypothetical protein